MKTLSPGLLWIAVLSFTIASCTKEEITPQPVPPVKSTVNEVSAAAVSLEDFESGTKTAYAAANVTLGSGSWNVLCGVIQ